MLVTLKTLQEDTFTVEIDPCQTVKHFKEKIEKIKGDEFPAKNMKLMYAGKFLVDTNRVCDYNVEEKKFVIIVVKKPKTAVNAEEPESTTDGNRDRVPYMNGRRNSGEQDLVLCAEHEALVQHITELGFTRAEVEAALCASYNNPDRAVEYLINGVLPSSSTSNDADPNVPRDPDHVSDASDAQLLRHISMTGPPSPGSASLPNQERIFELFNEAVDECQNRARIVDSLLEEDHDFITQSYAEMEAAARERAMAGGQGASAASGEAMPEGSAFASPDRVYDMWNDSYLDSQNMGFAGNLLDRDHEAIDRLKQLGFSDQKVIEAYFVCERNENAAADYLFSQNME